MDKKPLSFADFVVAKLVPEEDDYLAYRRQRRKRLGDSTSEAYDPSDKSDVDEALTVTQRLARKKQMRRLAPKLKMGRQRAARRIANKEKLEKRAMKQARMMIFKKLIKNVPKGELSYARRQEIEKRLEKPQVKQRIKMIAKKLFPKVRKAEIEKKTRSKTND